MKLKTLTAGVMLVALAACGGGGSGSGTSVGAVAPAAPAIASGSRSSTSVSLLIPRNDSDASPVAPSSKGRAPAFVSPGQNGITLIVDGTKILNNAALALSIPSTTSSTDPNTSVTTTYDPTPTDTLYYKYTIALTTTAGSHTFGAEILGNAPPIILSEAQATYVLAAGPNTGQTLTLQGVLGTGYIECADGPVDPVTGCSDAVSYTNNNNNGGTYTLTAIGADFDGFPIGNQAVTNGPITTTTGFDNAPFTVVEADGNAVVSILATDATTPGTQLTGPSGGFFVPAQAQYGHLFKATCLKSGTATLRLSIDATGPLAPLAGETYTTFDPSNNFPTGPVNYPGAGTLAVGSKTPGNPAYHGGANPNAVTNLPSVTCTASPATMPIEINAKH